MPNPEPIPFLTWLWVKGLKNKKNYLYRSFKSQSKNVIRRLFFSEKCKKYK